MWEENTWFNLTRRKDGWQNEAGTTKIWNKTGVSSQSSSAHGAVLHPSVLLFQPWQGVVKVGVVSNPARSDERKTPDFVLFAKEEKHAVCYLNSETNKRFVCDAYCTKRQAIGNWIWGSDPQPHVWVRFCVLFWKKPQDGRLEKRP